MNAKACLAAAVLLVVSSSLAGSAVISRDWKTPGDGLLTYDTVSGREWLDLTETQLFKFAGNTLEEKYATVIGELAPNGDYAGFVVAAEGDVRALAHSAGINTTTLNFQANGSASSTAIEFLGNTNDSSNAGQNTRSGGFILAESQDLASVWIVFNPESRTASHAGFRDLSGVLEPDYGFFGPPPLVETSGVWLYRQIPEPSTFLLFGTVLGAIYLFHLCQRIAT